MNISKNNMLLLTEFLRGEDEMMLCQMAINLGSKISQNKRMRLINTAAMGHIEHEPDSRIRGYVEEVVQQYRDATFHSHFRMSRVAFQVLCEELHSVQHTNHQPKTPLETKVMVTIWTLSNNESFCGVAARFDVSKSTAYYFIMEIIELLHSLMPRYMTWPNAALLNQIASIFGHSGFPGIIGCIDGCHIKVKPPVCHKEGFINRKGWPSINMLAICDNSMKFTYVYADRPGSCHDARVFRVSIAPNLLSTLSSDYHILGDSAQITLF